MWHRYEWIVAAVDRVKGHIESMSEIDATTVKWLSRGWIRKVGRAVTPEQPERPKFMRKEVEVPVKHRALRAEDAERK